MKIKPLLAGLAVAAASLSSHAAVVVSEGFDDITTLAGSGWLMSNQSTPAFGAGWFQGNPAVFTAQSGADDAYIGSNYATTDPDNGTISNWLITPVFSTATGGAITFWARADLLDGFFDTLEFGLVDANGTPTQLSGTQVLSGDWVQFTVPFAAAGAGAEARFAFHYTGAADESNYIGIDTVTVRTNDRQTVPEPASLGLIALALAGLTACRRVRRDA